MDTVAEATFVLSIVFAAIATSVSTTKKAKIE